MNWLLKQHKRDTRAWQVAKSTFHFHNIYQSKEHRKKLHHLPIVHKKKASFVQIGTKTQSRSWTGWTDETCFRQMERKCNLKTVHDTKFKIVSETCRSSVMVSACMVSNDTSVYWWCDSLLIMWQKTEAARWFLEYAGVTLSSQIWLNGAKLIGQSFTVQMKYSAVAP